MRRDELSYKLFEVSYRDGDAYVKMMDRCADYVLRREREMAEKIRSYLVNGTYNTSIGKALQLLDEIIKEASDGKE